MKCVNEMKFSQYFCYLIVLTTLICSKILLGDTRRNIGAFTENKSYVTDFLVIFLIYSLDPNGQEFVIIYTIQNRRSHTALPV